jgi:chaperonin GroES
MCEPLKASTKIEIIPLNDRVLIEPFNTENFSAGGIIVAGGEGSVSHAKVLAVGKGRAMPSGRIPIDVAVGDIVIYGDLNNTVEDKLNGKKVLLVVEQAIVAVIKE